MKLGSLFRFLKNPNPIPPETILNILKGIAAGMHHLSLQGIVHRDLAARNVLLQMVNQSIVAKITDFGLSRITSSPNEESQTQSNVGPIRW